MAEPQVGSFGEARWAAHRGDQGVSVRQTPEWKNITPIQRNQWAIPSQGNWMRRHLERRLPQDIGTRTDTAVKAQSIDTFLLAKQMMLSMLFSCLVASFLSPKLFQSLDIFFHLLTSSLHVSQPWHRAGWMPTKSRVRTEPWVLLTSTCGTSQSWP